MFLNSIIVVVILRNAFLSMNKSLVSVSWFHWCQLVVSYRGVSYNRILRVPGFSYDQWHYYKLAIISLWNKRFLADNWILVPCPSGLDLNLVLFHLTFFDDNTIYFFMPSGPREINSIILRLKSFISQFDYYYRVIKYIQHMCLPNSYRLSTF